MNLGEVRVKRERAVAVRDEQTREVLDMYLAGDLSSQQTLRLLLVTHGMAS